MILTVTLNAAIDKRYVVRNFQEGEVNRVLSCEYTPGGKGLNVSKPAAIAGADVVATGLVGGFAGKYIETELKKYRIKGRFYHVEGESRSCINIWDEKKRKQTEFLEPGFVITKEIFEDFIRYFKELSEQADVVVMSGSIPQGVETDAYQILVKEVKNQGKKVILDTSGELLKKGIKAKPSMIKPNMDEIRMLTGRDCATKQELIEAAVWLYRQGIETVVISMGKEGALMVCERGEYQAKVPEIDAVNTVGCGDSMVAGFALGFERRLSMREMLKKASAISAAAALREETGYFLREDMMKIYPEVKIDKIMEMQEEQLCH